MTSVAELEAQAEATRRALKRDIEALKRKARPQRLLADATTEAKAHGREFAVNATRRLRANPMPMVIAAVAVAGLAWLLARRRRPDRHRASVLVRLPIETIEGRPRL